MAADEEEGDGSGLHDGPGARGRQIRVAGLGDEGEGVEAGVAAGDEAPVLGRRALNARFVSSYGSVLFFFLIRTLPFSPPCLSLS